MKHLEASVKMSGASTKKTARLVWVKLSILLSSMVVDWCVVTSRPLLIVSKFFQNCKELELLRLVYYGGVQHEIRKEVWPFLLGHYKFGMGKKDMTQVKQILEFSGIKVS